MDALSDVLDTLRLRSRSGFRAELAAPWGFRSPERKGEAPFYILSRGSCRLEVEGHPRPVMLAGGDMVLLPQGSAHTLRDRPDTPVRPLEALLGCSAGTGEDGPADGEEQGTAAILIAGSFQFESRVAGYPGGVPLLTAMGTVVHLPAEAGHSPWLEMVVKLLCRETRGARPGAQAAIGRLLDLLFIEVVRAAMEAHAAHPGNCSGSFLRALVDPQLGTALEAIHRNPERNWTVAELAEEAGMSRTAFAVRFSRIAGLPPLAYLTQWRMVKACDLLCRSDATIGEVAARVGYDSEAAFSTAFKREIGVSPGVFRRDGAIRSTIEPGGSSQREPA